MPTVSYGIATTADDVTYAPTFGGILDSLPANGNTSGTIFTAGLRFIAVAVPQGATVSSATLTLKTDPANPATGSAWGAIKGVAADDAPIWTTTDPSAASKTTQSVTITSTATVAYDVTAIVQAIINRAGWASGNALAFAGDPTGANGYIYWIDRSNSSVDCAQLAITYATGGPASYAIDAAANGSGTAVGAGGAIRPLAGAAQASGTATGRFVPPVRTIKAYRFFPRFAGDSDAWYGGASVVTGPEFWDAAAGGASYTIDGAATGSGLSIGDASRTAPAAAVSAGIGISTGAAGRQAPGSADATGSGVAVGDMGVQGGVTGAATGAGAAVGDAGVQRPATGAASGSGTAVGAVLRLATINGVAVGSGTATGDASRTAPTAGNATGAGIASGDVGSTAPVDPTGLNALVNRRRRRSSVR